MKRTIIFIGFLFLALGFLVKPKRKIVVKKEGNQPLPVQEQNYSEEPVKMVSDIFDYSDPWINRFSVDKLPKGSND